MIHEKCPATAGGGDAGEYRGTENHIPSLADVQGQLTRFVDCVFDPSDLIELRRLPSGQSSWHVASELPQLARRLIDENRNAENIYVGVNPRTRRGGRCAGDVALARCLFADLDNTTPDEGCERCRSAGLPVPTLTVASGHGVHCYWRLEEPVAAEVWTNWQRNIADVLGSDPSVHDAPRLTRLPGFTNHKAPIAQSYILDADSSRVYELAELHEVIPERAPAAPHPPVAADRATRAAPQGLDMLARAARYAQKWPSIAVGSRNAEALRHAAQLTHDFALNTSQAWPILAGWNAKNDPPLDETELRACLQNGERYGKHPVGCKADAPPPKRNATAGAPPTDSLPADPGPSWHTIREIGSSPTYGQGVPPITTGYTSLDTALRGGFRPESTYIIAGRTGSAKSTFALNVCRKTALSGYGVLLFKLEESPTEATWRMHAAAAQVPLHVLLDGERASKAHGDKLADGWQLLRDLPIRISDRRELDAIGRISREHVADGGRLIVLDQLSLVTVPDCGSQYERVSLISNTLRLLARDLHVPIVAVAQVNREASKHKKRGELTANDLRDSGQLENDAAAVLLLDRHPFDTAPNKRQRGEPTALGVAIGKNRYGPLSDPLNPVLLWWWPWTCRIEDGIRVAAEGAV